MAKSLTMRSVRSMDKRGAGVGAMEAQWRAILTRAGIQVDGGRPWDMQIRDARAYDRIMA